MRIALIGYGKMGKEIEKIAIDRGHRIVSIIDVNNQEEFNSENFKSANVAIEFTGPKTAYENYKKTFAAGVKVVSGSTGWMEKYGEEIKRLCREEGKTLFWASNFSLGIAIFSAVNRCLSKIMNRFPSYEVSITETHHLHKLDAPSGTAITLAEEILANIPYKTRWVKGKVQEPNELSIESVREGEVFGTHSVRYDSAADSIVLTHDAKNRQGFALGAVLAAEYTAEHNGFLGINDLFSF